MCFILGEKPQALLYSATLPSWVHNTAKKYMSEDKKVVDLIGTQSLKAAETVQVDMFLLISYPL